MIRNKKTGQMYIGQSKNIELRFKKHCYVQPVDLDIANEGVDNFDFIILEEVVEDDLIEREQYWIQYYNTYNDDCHYNMCLTPKHDKLTTRKYFLWDTRSCGYNKTKMYRDGREPNPCRCFRFKYNGEYISIGQFHDFVTCAIINQLIEEAIKDEIK